MKEDSIEGIYDTLKECAVISKSAGGIGVSIHNIRATGSYIRGTNGTSNGIVPMLRVFNDTARYVDQGGGKRKGSCLTFLCFSTIQWVGISCFEHFLLCLQVLLLCTWSHGMLIYLSFWILGKTMGRYISVVYTSFFFFWQSMYVPNIRHKFSFLVGRAPCKGFVLCSLGARSLHGKSPEQRAMVSILP